MRCRTCHYRLGGLTDDRCPECGRSFDPRDSSTFDPPADLIGNRLARLFLLFVTVYLIVLLVQLIRIRMDTVIDPELGVSKAEWGWTYQVLLAGYRAILPTLLLSPIVTAGYVLAYTYGFRRSKP